MPALLLMTWLWLAWLPDKPLPIGQISQTNHARQDAEYAYKSGRYQQALSIYTYLNEVSNTPDPTVWLNLGHTYFQLRQYGKAAQQYTKLQQVSQAALRTVAATQLGIIACRQRDSSTALTLFRQALLIDFTNEPARHNFELIKRRYVPRQPGMRQPATQTASQAMKPAQTAGRVERSSRQDELLRRFRQMNLTEEQALQLLNAMQHDDLPYALTRTARKPTTGKETTQEDQNRW